MDGDRAFRAVEMRLAGATYEQIARQLGYADRATAFGAIRAVIDEHLPIDEDQLATELARLDALLVSLWPKARAGDLGSIDRVLKISERRSVLLGHPVASPHDDQESGLDEFTRRLRERETAP